MSAPRYSIDLLLPCLSWGGDIEAQGRRVTRERQVGWAAQEEDWVEGETMTYKRGGVYWYKFRWTLKLEGGIKESYLLRKSARTSNVKRAREVEEEHRRALRMGT